MTSKEVVIYISNNSPYCTKVLDFMEENNISYKTKNVTENSAYMKELQAKGIYGTPAMFVEDEAILGLQFNKMKRVLGIDNGMEDNFF